MFVFIQVFIDFSKYLINTIMSTTIIKIIITIKFYRE